MSTTRRDALRSIAAGAATVAFLPSLAEANPTTDPIIAAIERARTACAAFVANLDREEALEAALPRDVRQSENYGDTLTIVETDAPEWIAYVRDYRATCDAADNAFCAVIEKEEYRPTTLHGVAALLRFSADSYRSGAPDCEFYDERTGITEGWHQAIDRMCADVVLQLVARNS